MGLVFFLTRPLHFISRERIYAHITFCRIPVLRETYSWVFFWSQFGITIHLGFCSWLITAPASLSVVLASCFLLLDARSSFVSRSSFSLISSHSMLLITWYKVFIRLLAARLLWITVACVGRFIARPISPFFALIIFRVCSLLLTFTVYSSLPTAWSELFAVCRSIPFLVLRFFNFAASFLFLTARRSLPITCLMFSFTPCTLPTFGISLPLPCWSLLFALFCTHLAIHITIAQTCCLFLAVPSSMSTVLYLEITYPSTVFLFLAASYLLPCFFS